jgi:hypothetical protein
MRRWCTELGKYTSGNSHKAGAINQEVHRTWASRRGTGPLKKTEHPLKKQRLM